MLRNLGIIKKGFDYSKGVHYLCKDTINNNIRER